MVDIDNNKLPHPQASRIIQRIKAVVLVKQGVSIALSAWYVGLCVDTVNKWLSRADSGGDFFDKPRSGRPPTFRESVFFKIIAFYCQTSGLAQNIKLSLRWCAAYFCGHREILGCSISASSIWRMLKKHSLRPHKYKYFLQITDPEFFSKMEPIIQLYINPPPYLFCLDECTGLQALQRYYPSLPPKQNQPGLKEFDYIRHGTTTLFGIFHVNSGKVFGRCQSSHNSETLVTILEEHIRTFPSDEKLHYILDNYSTHYHDRVCQMVARLCQISYEPLKTAKERREWLQNSDKRIVFHFLPFHGSWLSQVEILFGIMKAKCLKDGSFKSVAELITTIDEFIHLWNTYFFHPFEWNYTGRDLHQKVVRRFSRWLLLKSRHVTGKFLKKQLLLMQQLILHYFDKVEWNDWKQLLVVMGQRNDYIQVIIDKDEKLQEIFCEVEKMLAKKLFLSNSNKSC